MECIVYEYRFINLKKLYNMRKFNEFVGLYPISKTLRFELKPIGKTLEHIQRNKLLEHDAVRADDYVKVMVEVIILCRNIICITT